VDESTVYSAIHGNALFFDCNPDQLSNAPTFANISRSESAYELDLLTFNAQKVTLPMLDIFYQTAVNGGFNNTWLMPVGFFPDIYGGLVTNCSNTTVNAAAINLYSIRAMFDITFHFRH